MSAVHPLDEPLLPPGTCVGPYQLLRPLGRGGYGTVCLAVDEVEGVEVAVKLHQRAGSAITTGQPDPGQLPGLEGLLVDLMAARTALQTQRDTASAMVS